MPSARDACCAAVLMLLGIGLLMVFSASMTSRPSMAEQTYLLRHLTFLGIAVTGCVAAAMMPVSLWQRIAPALFVVTLGLLVIVLIPGVGTEVNGFWLPNPASMVMIAEQRLLRVDYAMQAWRSSIQGCVKPQI